MKKILFLNLILLLSAFNLHAQTEAEGNKRVPAPAFRYREQMPDPGYSINEYISNNLVYPLSAAQNNVQGRVVVKFIIRENGMIDSVHAINNPVFGYGLEEAAIDLINKMPRWKKPGKQDGKPVKVYYSLPITFKLTNY